MNIKDKIKVMQHYDEGGDVQANVTHLNSIWTDSIAPSWDWNNYSYRIKVPFVKGWYLVYTTGQEKYKMVCWYNGSVFCRSNDPASGAIGNHGDVVVLHKMEKANEQQ